MLSEKYREESDSLGTIKVPADVLYGIHAMRAQENFPDRTLFHVEWYKAMGLVKLACYKAYRQFRAAVLDRANNADVPFSLLEARVTDALESSAAEVSEGKHFEAFIVPAINGGAGTSINMNVNEIIANVALLKLGLQPGSYETIHPIETANIYQSTNDVVPTALKVAMMQLLGSLESQ